MQNAPLFWNLWHIHYCLNLWRQFAVTFRHCYKNLISIQILKVTCLLISPLFWKFRFHLKIRKRFTQAEIQRHFTQEILRISLFIYYKNVHFAQEIYWKMSKNFSLAVHHHVLPVLTYIHSWFHFDFRRWLAVLFCFCFENWFPPIMINLVLKFLQFIINNIAVHI